jgi:hypothetical protein
MDKLPKETVRDGEPASFRKNDEKMKNEIARLSALDIVGLRLAWRNIFGKTAPSHCHPPTGRVHIAHARDPPLFL